MSWVLLSVLVVLAVSLGILPSFAQSMNTYPVKDLASGQSYNAYYSIRGGNVTDMSIDPQATSLVISLQTTGDGFMTVTLPRTLIDAKAETNDDQFFVLEDGANIDFQESKTDAERTLSISFTDGTEKIEVIGTQVVPEFGSLTVIIITISIIGAIVISRKFGLIQKV